MTYSIPASSLGAALGLQGVNRQHRAVVDVLRRSEFKHLVTDRASNPTGGEFRKTECFRRQRRLLLEMGVEKIWEDEVMTAARACRDLSGVRALEARVTALLFGSSLVERLRREHVQSDLMPAKVRRALEHLISDRGTAELLESHTMQTVRKRRLLGPLLEVLRTAHGLRSFAVSTARRSYGSHAEGVYIERYNAYAAGPPIESRGESFSVRIGKGGQLRVVGRLDGVSDREVVEVKFRCHWPGSKPLPPADLVQVHLYMRMTGAAAAVIHECIGDGQFTHSRAVRVPFCEDLWAAVEASADSFCGFLDSLRDSPLAAQCYFRLPEGARAEILRRHITELPEGMPAAPPEPG